jgi:hypothetical protein
MNKMSVTLSLCIVLLSGCSGNGSKSSETTDQIIRVEEALKQPEKILLSDIGKEVVYVPLETTDSSLVSISSSSTMRLLDDMILIGTKNHPIKVFDKKTGHYLREIGKIGNGPGEYADGAFFHIDAKTQNIYVEVNPSQRHIYSKDGNLIKTITYNSPIGVLTSPLFLDEILYSFVTIPSPATTCFSEIYDLRTQTKLDSLKLSDNNIPASEIEMVMPFSGMEMFGGRSFMMKIKNQTWTFGSRENPPFWSYKDELRLKDVYNDTVFTIKNSFSDMQPRYIFDLGKWGGFKRYETEDYMSDKLIITRILETDNLIYFNMIQNMYNLNNWIKRNWPPMYCGIYNKKDGTTKVGETLNIKNDKIAFPDFSIYNVSNNGELVACYQAESLIEARENIPESDQPDWLKNLKEDDNPVIMIIK